MTCLDLTVAPLGKINKRGGGKERLETNLIQRRENGRKC